jgi:Condensation domain
VNGGDLGPLSWQQRDRFDREQRRGRVPWTITTTVQLPGQTPPGEVRRRLAELADAEDVLRIIELSAQGEGWTRYGSGLPLPLVESTAESGEEVAAYSRAQSGTAFARDAGPLWSVAALRHPDDRGSQALSICAAFDHMISDARTIEVFRDRIASQTSARAAKSGRYRDWVSWQNREFRPGRSGVSPRAREFWLRHLDGTSAERVTELPFCLGEAAEASGRVQTVLMALTLPVPTVADAARKARSTPFMLFLACAASATAAAAQSPDITLKVMTHGRPPGFFDTLGWFADCVPLRLCYPDLWDPPRALAAARSAWLDVIEFETTPWSYIVRECSPASAPQRRPPQIVVNVIPYVDADAADAPLTIGPVEVGDVSGLQLVIAPRPGGRYGVAAQFDPSRFVVSGAADFLRLFAAHLAVLAGLPAVPRACSLRVTCGDGGHQELRAVRRRLRAAARGRQALLRSLPCRLEPGGLERPQVRDQRA